MCSGYRLLARSDVFQGAPSCSVGWCSCRIYDTETVCGLSRDLEIFMNDFQLGTIGQYLVFMPNRSETTPSGAVRLRSSRNVVDG